MHHRARCVEQEEILGEVDDQRRSQEKRECLLARRQVPCLSEEDRRHRHPDCEVAQQPQQSLRRKLFDELVVRLIERNSSSGERLRPDVPVVPNGVVLRPPSEHRTIKKGIDSNLCGGKPPFDRPVPDARVQQAFDHRAGRVDPLGVAPGANEDDHHDHRCQRRNHDGDYYSRLTER